MPKNSQSDCIDWNTFILFAAIMYVEKMIGFENYSLPLTSKSDESVIVTRLSQRCLLYKSSFDEINTYEFNGKFKVKKWLKKDHD